jgi:hypothetical protein
VAVAHERRDRPTKKTFDNGPAECRLRLIELNNSLFRREFSLFPEYFSQFH